MTEADNSTVFFPTKENIVKILLDYGIFDFEIESKIDKQIDPTTITITRKAKKYILRVSKSNTTKDQVLTEVYILNELYSKGVRVPFILSNIRNDLITTKSINGKNWFCYLMELDY